jgi:hypothetical protein
VKVNESFRKIQHHTRSSKYLPSALKQIPSLSKRLFDGRLSSLTSTDVIVSHILCLSSSTVWGLFEYNLFFRLSHGCNSRGLSLETLEAAVSELAVCLQTPHLKCFIVASCCTTFIHSLLSYALLCATYQVFESKVSKFCHGIKLHHLKLLSTSLKFLRVILHFVSHYMFQPVGHHQVLLLSGNCCTFFALFLCLIL